MSSAVQGPCADQNTPDSFHRRTGTPVVFTNLEDHALHILKGMREQGSRAEVQTPSSDLDLAGFLDPFAFAAFAR